jgi:SAM-dependent methyltransferase
VTHDAAASMRCRHCAAELTLPFLDLGSAPPSNAYLARAQLAAPETRYPLRVLACTECWLVQTEDHAGREQLFSADYAYFSSVSSSWLAHARAYVHAMRARFGLGPRSLVAEVASNDGYLLQYAAQADIPCYGIEPTASTAAAARAKGLEVVEEFFGVALAERLVAQGRQVDLVAANNVLAHVPDINDFAAGFVRLLKPQGVATFEFPHLLQLVRQAQFDTVYHEHYSYLSLTAVRRVFRHAGLAVFDVEQLPTHGGSLRVFAQRADLGTHAVTPSVAAVLADEEAAGMTTPGFYAGFQARAERVKDDLLAFLVDARRQGLRVGAYGAAAKGNTLLNFAGVRPDLLPYVVDRNPAKAGRWMPGSRIPIVDEGHLQADRPDVVLILPWNLQDEVTAQLAYVRDWGGRFATAVPSLQVA